MDVWIPRGAEWCGVVQGLLQEQGAGMVKVRRHTVQSWTVCERCRHRQFNPKWINLGEDGFPEFFSAEAKAVSTPDLEFYVIGEAGANYGRWLCPSCARAEGYIW